MPRTYVSFVDDEVLVNEVQQMMNKYEQAVQVIDDSIYDNNIDPFSAFLEASLQDISFEDWLRQEKHRKIQKSFQSEVGYFHQHILGSIDGWLDPGDGGGYDCENIDRRIIAEIKNKYNTFNADSKYAIYQKMAGFLDAEKAGYQGYVVVIIPRNVNRYQVPFTGGRQTVERADLLEIDGASFYTLCTGLPDALRQLYRALPQVIQHISPLAGNVGRENSPHFIDLFNRVYGP